MIKKLVIIIAACIFLAGELTGQEKASSGTDAEIKFAASTIAGYDFDTGSFGLNTGIRYLDVWFEILPTKDRGFPLKTGYSEENVESWGSPYASMRLVNGKWAMKWWTPTIVEGTTPATTMTSTPYYDKIIADLVYGPLYLRVAATESSLESNKASLWTILTPTDSSKTVFLDARDLDSFQIPLLSSIYFNNKDKVSDDLKTSADKTGHLRLGYDGKFVDASLEFATKTDWTAPKADNAFALQADLKFHPIDAWEIGLASTVRSNYTAGLVTPITFSLGSRYEMDTEEGGIFEPFIGFDGQIDQGIFGFEVGAGFGLYWDGKGRRFKNFMEDYWNDLPIGMSLSFNLNDKGQMNLVASLIDDAGYQSLIPNLGILLHGEVIDLFSMINNPGYGATLRLEYQIEKILRPYLQGAIETSYTTGSLDGKLKIGSQIGILVNAIPNFSLDIKYARKDLINTSNSTISLDGGLLTIEFLIKNH